MSEKIEVCIRGAIEAAKNTGFTENHFIGTLDDKSASTFYAYSKQGPYALTVHCDKNTGTSSLAVSGINLDDTNQLFEKVINLYPKR